MKEIVIHDRASYQLTTRTYTDEGFLKVAGRVARTGTQEYFAQELGLTDRSPLEIIKVYRPPEEVFNETSLDSYLGADITNNHPAQGVDKNNYKSTSVGVVIGSGRRDGDFVVADLIIKDAATIKEIENGKNQLSAGYSAIYEQSPDSEFDYIQRCIKINHVAIVDRARAGAQATLFDSALEENMSKTIKVGDTEFDLTQSDFSEKLNAYFNDMQTKLKLANDSLGEMEGELATMTSSFEEVQGKLDATIEALAIEKLKTSMEAITAKLAELFEVKQLAEDIAGKEFSCDSVDASVIIRAALKATNDSVDWDSKSDDYCLGCATALRDNGIVRSHVTLANDMQTVATKKEAKQSAYAIYKQNQAFAWKNQ